MDKWVNRCVLGKFSRRVPVLRVDLRGWIEGAGKDRRSNKENV